MPLYEYRCSSCGGNFELLRRIEDADGDLVCPRCQSEEIERLLSTFAKTGGGCGPRGGRFT
jgi:putative FmdB family regulatory protein